MIAFMLVLLLFTLHDSNDENDDGSDNSSDIYAEDINTEKKRSNKMICSLSDRMISLVVITIV
jgi:hypothetical protein